MVWDQTFSDQQSVSFSDQQFCIQSVSQNCSSPAQQLCRLSVLLSFSQFFPVYHFTSPAAMHTISIYQWFSDWQFCIQAGTQYMSVIFSLPFYQSGSHADTQYMSVIFRLAVLYTVRHSELASYFQFTSCVYSQTLRTYQLFSAHQLCIQSDTQNLSVIFSSVVQ